MEKKMGSEAEAEIGVKENQDRIHIKVEIEEIEEDEVPNIENEQYVNTKSGKSTPVRIADYLELKIEEIVAPNIEKEKKLNNVSRKSSQFAVTDYLEVKMEENVEDEVPSIEKERNVSTKSGKLSQVPVTDYLQVKMEENEVSDVPNIQKKKQNVNIKPRKASPVRISDYLEVKIEEIVAPNIEKEKNLNNVSRKSSQFAVTDYLEVKMEENVDSEVQDIEKEHNLSTKSGTSNTVRISDYEVEVKNEENVEDEVPNIERKNFLNFTSRKASPVRITDYLEVKIEENVGDEVPNMEKKQKVNTNPGKSSQVTVTDYLEVQMEENVEGRGPKIEKEQNVNTKPGKRKRIRYVTEKQKSKKAAYIQEHCVQKGCNDSCSKQCSAKFSEEDRNIINNYYWSLSWEEQHVFLKHSACLAIPKKKKTKQPKRHPRRTFFFKLGGKKTEVCRCFFLTTLGYKSTNDKALYNALSNDEPTDNRGKHRYIAFANRELLVEHIESFNPTYSHNGTEETVQRKYLPSNVTATAMYENFLKKYPEIKLSYESYRREMRSLNVFVKRPSQKNLETSVVKVEDKAMDCEK